MATTRRGQRTWMDFETGRVPGIGPLPGAARLRQETDRLRRVRTGEGFGVDDLNIPEDEGLRGMAADRFATGTYRPPADDPPMLDVPGGGYATGRVPGQMQILPGARESYMDAAIGPMHDQPQPLPVDRPAAIPEAPGAPGARDFGVDPTTSRSFDAHAMRMGVLPSTPENVAAMGMSQTQARAEQLRRRTDDASMAVTVRRRARDELDAILRGESREAAQAQRAETERAQREGERQAAQDERRFKAEEADRDRRQEREESHRQREHEETLQRMIGGKEWKHGGYTFREMGGKLLMGTPEGEIDLVQNPGAIDLNVLMGMAPLMPSLARGNPELAKMIGDTMKAQIDTLGQPIPLVVAPPEGTPPPEGTGTQRPGPWREGAQPQGGGAADPLREFWTK